LATSREALRVQGEITWRVPPLAVPDLQQSPSVDQLLGSPAVRLFADRARAVQSGFELTPQSARSVAHLCAQLDGLPLAIELAAARINVLTVEQIAARIADRFGLLAGGGRTAVPRQRTLRASVDWSYDLLSEQERRLLRRLSIFAGGWTLEAAETVCSGEGIEQQDVFDLLVHLVRKSMVVSEEGRAGAGRYRLLETLRQYARERLVAAAELEATHNRHASYYLALAEEVEPSMWEVGWLHRLLPEQDNLRAALRWLRESNAVEKAVQLGGRLWPMWLFAGYLTEGQTQLRGLMELPGVSRRSPEWARLAMNAGLVDFFAGNLAPAHARLEEAVAVRRVIGDPHLARTLVFLGLVARERGDYAAAQVSFSEGLALGEEIEDRACIVHAYDCIGTIAHLLGDYALARSWYERGLALAREWDDRVEAPWLLHNLGCLALDQGDYAAARAWLAQAVTSRSEYDNLGFVHALAGFASLAAAEGLSAAAVRLAGATAALIQRTGIAIQHSEHWRFERALAAARKGVAEEVAAMAWSEGQQMRPHQAVAYALSLGVRVPVSDAKPAGPWPAQSADQLTAREHQVAALLAEGLNNRQIAVRLVITQRTVAAHIEHILDKLGLDSRTQIALWAAERNPSTRDPV
jgi:predicted ATPase/DNA-binding CsgD family transcriptional regulator